MVLLLGNAHAASFTPLGDLAGGTFRSIGWGLSADGRVVVGSSNSASGTEAFRWTAGGGMAGLGDLPGGMERLQDVLLANGATGLTGWTLEIANGISADGRWVVGAGTNPSGYREAFLAVLQPVPLPAAAWLFGSALGVVLGLVRRQASGK
ncbi:MAG: hypothetical protein KJ054_12915 [Gammaproteobacteria bacterium]|nr:hypothetical protein [Gammaproteobacteria bacterium]